jgi:hypothetical protein
LLDLEADTKDRNDVLHIDIWHGRWIEKELLMACVANHTREEFKHDLYACRGNSDPACKDERCIVCGQVTEKSRRRQELNLHPDFNWVCHCMLSVVWLSPDTNKFLDSEDQVRFRPGARFVFTPTDEELRIKVVRLTGVLLSSHDWDYSNEPNHPYHLTKFIPFNEDIHLHIVFEDQPTQGSHAPIVIR